MSRVKVANFEPNITKQYNNWLARLTFFLLSEGEALGSNELFAGLSKLFLRENHLGKSTQVCSIALSSFLDDFDATTLLCNLGGYLILCTTKERNFSSFLSNAERNSIVTFLQSLWKQLLFSPHRKFHCNEFKKIQKSFVFEKIQVYEFCNILYMYSTSGSSNTTLGRHYMLSVCACGVTTVATNSTSNLIECPGQCNHFRDKPYL